MGIENYETLQHCSITLNQTALGWQASVLSANFGGGYEASAVTVPYGLKRWNLQASLLPDNETAFPFTYVVGADTLTKSRFRYFFEFFQRHILLGNKPFVIRDADTTKKFLVSFAETNVDFDRLEYQLFAGNVVVNERRVSDLMFNDDGSIFDGQTPYVSLFIADPITDSLIRIYMSAGDADEVTGYDLEFSLSGGNPDAAPGTGGWTVLLDDATPASPYNHTGRTGNTRYYYRFRARDNDENVSGWVFANALTFATPDVTAPTMTYFDAQGLYSLSEIRIFFAATDDQTASANLRYDLQWSLNGTSGWTNIRTKQAVTTTPVIHTGLNPNTQYFYRMRAWDAADNISDWITDSATTLADETSPQITAFSATGGFQQISLAATFSDNIGVTGVDLQWATDALGSAGWNNLLNNAAPTTATTLAYTHTGLADNTTRFYRLRVRDAAGLVTAYATANATTTGAGGSGAAYADGTGATWLGGTPIDYA